MSPEFHGNMTWHWPMKSIEYNDLIVKNILYSGKIIDETL